VAGRNGGFVAWLFAVKAPVNLLSQLARFGWVIGICHALCQLGEFCTGQLAFARQLQSKVNDSGLLCRRQMLDLLNDAGSCHEADYNERCTRLQMQRTGRLRA